MGETYEDPITKKSRELIFGLLMHGDERLRIHLSVECKNVKHRLVYLLSRKRFRIQRGSHRRSKMA